MALTKPRPTRYPELGYRFDAPGCWRVVDMSDASSIGPQYRTKAELLGDLNRFATDFGCAAAPKPDSLRALIDAGEGAID